MSDRGQLIGKKIDALRMDLGEMDNKTFSIKNLRLIETTRQLKLYAALGEKINEVDTFGIGLKDLKSHVSSNETVRYQDENSLSITQAVYQYLDLDAETKRLSNQAGVIPPVPLGPRIVAGKALTLTIILSFEFFHLTRYVKRSFLHIHQIFVEASESKRAWMEKVDPLLPHGRYPQNLPAKSICSIRAGGTKGKIQVPEEINPPYDLAVGEFFAKSPGDEIALTSEIC